MTSIYFFLFIVLLTNVNSKNVLSTVRIYSNLAEIIQPLDNLPLEFTDENWNSIRSDSITLLGENLNITLQTITEKKKSFNGTEVYIRSPISSDKTTVKLIKAILIDEDRNLVKIQDQSIADQENLYFTVSSDQIYYLEQPTKSKYYVDFKYKSANSKIYVSYLQSNLHWKTQYQLNLLNDESELISKANIRNDGKSSLSINQAELIGGDINLQTQQQHKYERSFRTATYSNLLAAQPQMSEIRQEDNADSQATVEKGKELAGLYIFPISKPFTINAKTNYLLSMFRPHVSIERYGLISREFSPAPIISKAQRSYRLKSDRYLAEGHCIIRENDRVVGETKIPNLAAKNKYEFSIGEDADIIIKENITLISSRTYNKTETNIQTSNDGQLSPILIVTRTELVYNVYTELKNFKDRPVKIEYEQKGLHIYHSISLTTPPGYNFTRDSSSIKSDMTLKANTVERFSYTLVLVQ